MSKKQTFFDRPFSPIRLAIYIAIGLVVFVLISRLFKTGEATSNDLPYIFGGAALLFFIMFSSIFSLATKDIQKYWQYAIYSYIGLAAHAIGLGYLVTGLSIGEVGTFKWIYFVLTVGFLVFLTLISLIRFIVTQAENEVWEKPKERKK